MANGVDVTYLEIDSSYGHDAFLLEVERITQVVGDFLAHVAIEEGVKSR